MATSYEDLLPEILPLVPLCPEPFARVNVRSAFIELCERADVYQIELDAITTVNNTYEYDLETPSNTLVSKILSVTHSGKNLKPITPELLDQRIPDWRTTTGTPEYYVKVSPTVIWLAPVPDATTALSTTVRAALKQTVSSSSADTDTINDYRDVIVNGALARLFRVPNREWSDLNSAQIYLQLFEQGLQQAERKATHKDQPVVRKVKYGGL